MAENTEKIEKSVNGDDLLLIVNGKAVGHCTSHTINITAETKEHAFKPKASAPKSSSKFKNKTIVSLACSISFEGLVFYNESEMSAAELARIIMEGKSVGVKSYVRGNQVEGTADKPWLTGNFVATNFTKTAPAKDDTTYSGQFENDGAFDCADNNFLNDAA